MNRGPCGDGDLTGSRSAEPQATHNLVARQNPALGADEADQIDAGNAEIGADIGDPGLVEVAATSFLGHHGAASGDGQADHERIRAVAAATSAHQFLMARERKTGRSLDVLVEWEERLSWAFAHAHTSSSLRLNSLRTSSTAQTSPSTIMVSMLDQSVRKMEGGSRSRRPLSNELVSNEYRIDAIRPAPAGSLRPPGVGSAPPSRSGMTRRCNCR